MEVSPDYEELFRVLNAHKVRYLVVGAHAVIYYSEPRFTKDLGVWIPPSLNDSRRVYKALAAYGVPLRGVSIEDFSNPSFIFQIGVAPVRVDLLMHIAGVDPKLAWKHRQRSRYGKASVFILGLWELMQSKKSAGRPLDRIDLAVLKDRSKRRRGY